MEESTRPPSQDPVLLPPLLVDCRILPAEVRRYLKIQQEHGRLDEDPVADRLLPIFDRHRSLLQVQSDFSFHLVPELWTAAILGSAVTVVLASFFLPTTPITDRAAQDFLALAYLGGMVAAALIGSLLHVGESFRMGWEVDVELGLATGIFVLPGTSLLVQVFSADLSLGEALVKGFFLGLVAAVTFSPVMAFSGGAQMGGFLGRLAALLVKALFGREDVEGRISEAIEPFRTVMRKTIEEHEREAKSNDHPPPG